MLGVWPKERPCGPSTIWTSRSTSAGRELPRANSSRGLRIAFARPIRDFGDDQFDDSQPNCVTIRFKGTGLDVDVVPVLYEGDEHDKGYLIDKHTGESTLTSIPLHLEFIRSRKKRAPHYAQVVRLVKWWAAVKKAADPNFKCKSFLLELLLAELADEKADFSDYPSILDTFFSRIVRTVLESRVAFRDYYKPSALPAPTGAPIEVFDPVNPENNVTEKYTVADRERLVEAAEEAADAISEAMYATTKARAIACWQRVLFGTTFRG